MGDEKEIQNKMSGRTMGEFRAIMQILGKRRGNNRQRV